MEEHERHDGKKVDIEGDLGVSRRDMLRRAAIVGGTLVWVAPAIQTIARPALADTGQESPFRHVCCYCYNGSATNPSPTNPKTQTKFEFTADGNTSNGPRDSFDDCRDYCINEQEYEHFQWKTSTVAFGFSLAQGGCFTP